MNRSDSGAIRGPRQSKSAQAAKKSGIAELIVQRGRGALTLLLEAYDCAHDVDRSVWDFAVEIHALREAGLTTSGLRWLVCRGFAEHARELPPSDQTGRLFRAGRGGLTFEKETCFVLTEAGTRFARKSIGQRSHAGRSVGPRRAGRQGHRGQRLVPKWDRDRQELRVGRRLVKQFKLPAANQERILAAFEEEGWPVHIDDPLPPHPEQDSKRRLHDTINSLNRNQRCPLIRFQGDGTGQGVRWSLAEPTEDGNESGNSQP